jgi:UDP-N-acetyl-D-glucosamine/UDP-N-acetyl-D-galactosamine dehydrogenase
MGNKPANSLSTNEHIDLTNAVVCVIGAGYVGLPLSEAFARDLKTISFDIDKAKTKRLAAANKNPNHIFTSDPHEISKADFVSISVPTPITKSKAPDMSYVESAARTVGKHLKKKAVVILESSVYPGVTEEIVKPAIEQESGYKYGLEFKLAYSPERINPGDTEHNVDKVTKIVAADDPETLNIVSELYHHVTPYIFKAKNIKTAEAAKLVENTQRDLNIALVNELSIMFEKMGLNTQDVLDAAATKWNFQRFSPGLVGGYCIPVVPYFLVHKAEELGYHPRVILAGRTINDYMPKHVAEMAVKSINNAGKVIKGSRVLIMGVTYKENVEDTRETPVRDVIKELQDYGIEVFGFDPIAKEPEKAFGIRFIEDLGKSPKMDCVILAVAHDAFKQITPGMIKEAMNSYPVLIDIRGFYDTPEMYKLGFIYKRL